MAIQECRECGNAVSTQAEHCPHCGVARGKAWHEREFSFGKLLIVGLIVWGVWGYIKGNDPAPKQAKVTDAQCQQKLSCWGDRHLAAASGVCARAIESLAKWQVRWTDGALDVKFSHYGWADEQKKYIRFGGDKIQFQNGFGAWQGHAYTCDYNPFERKVIAVNSVPGRL